MPDDDSRLVQRLKRRDEAAFTELVRRYQDRVFGLIYRMLGDRAEAEDVAQEVFVTVFKSIDGFRGDSQLGTWLYRVAANHCKNRLKYLARRARSAQREYTEGDHPADTSAGPSARIAGPEAAAVGRETERLVQEALAALPEDQRELIVLRDVENLSYEEIGAVTGLVEGTIKSRLHRARLALQKRVGELDGSAGAPSSGRKERS
jgi:RNA polymerase sigma-70 factor, ECF subfamily